MQIVDKRAEMPRNPDPKVKISKRKLSLINKIVLHCDDWDTDLMTIANYDVTPSPNHHISPKGCPSFTYHYFIEKDGTVYYCQDLTDITWHVGDHNGVSIGICIRYQSTGNPNPPPEEQLIAAENLMTRLCLELGIDPDNIKGHRELLGTGYNIVDGKKKLRKSCPGMLVNMDKVRYVVAMAIQEVLASLGFYKGDIDGDFGPKSEAALSEYRKSKSKE